VIQPRPLTGGVAADAALPERVEAAIAGLQDRSERAIGWFQLGVLAVFASLYAAAPSAAGAMFDASTLGLERLPPALAAAATLALMHAVPIALGLYFIATVVRLFWAYAARLPGWLLACSILIDMTLLFGLIWSFHIQYGQPPAFYLKAPTLLYVFIFIALRALRFEARYVLISGFTAAAGWLALVFYAAAFDAQGIAVTRNHVEYMTSARILWGAEIDKVIAILVVTGLLARAMGNARRLLVRAVAEGTAATDLKRFFSVDVSTRITGAVTPVEPGHGEIRDAAILFTDLRGFTPLARTLSPDAVVALLGEYQSRVLTAIAAHGGTVDKFLGDGILASFGCARPSTTFAADALRAVDAIVEDTVRWSAERTAAGAAAVSVGAAVASGSVLFGAIGDATRLEYTVIGDAVNLAAKLEKHTKLENVRALADRSTYERARTQGYTPEKELRPRRAVGGVDAPIDVVVLA